MTSAAFPTFAARSLPRVSRYFTTGARCALGLVFFSFGLMGLLNLLPPPSEPMPAGALALGTAFANSGYLFPLIKGTETLAGALLLANCFVPLALTLLAPVIVNIVAFHFFLTPGEVGLPIALLGIELYLAWVNRAAYRGLLTLRSPALTN